MLKPSLRRLTTAPWFQTAVGVVAAEYLRLVWKTSRFALEPPDIYQIVKPDLPVIVAMWHGQHFLMPFIKLKDHRAKMLISHHRDGAINAVAAQRLGVEVIRGSGTHGQDFDRKGGTSAFMELLTALQDGYNVALTADVPKVSRVCGTRHRQAGQHVRPPDLSACDRDQPAACARQLGSQRRSFSVLPRRSRRRDADPRAAQRRRCDARSGTP